MVMSPLGQNKAVRKWLKRVAQKLNFTESELEVLISEVEIRKNILFGTLSSGINNKRILI